MSGSCTISFSMKPISSISTLTLSPGTNQFCVANADPSGVPVGIKSPGFKVKAVDKYSIRV